MERDVVIISAAQKIEHYENATYGTLCTLSKNLGEDEIVDFLGENLDEEKKSNNLLKEIAESSVNQEALLEENTFKKKKKNNFLFFKVVLS